MSDTQTRPMLRRGVRNYAAKRIGFDELARGGTARSVIDRAGELDVVFLCTPHLATIADVRAFLDCELPPGWSEGDHYLRTPNPLLRFVLDGGEHELVVGRAASWFGEGADSPAYCELAWNTFGELVENRFDEGRLLTTPATTGRFLLLRSIEYGREWPVLDDNRQELIRSTSGQGRIQVIDRGAQHGSLVEYDGRLMYGALCRDLGAGEPQHDTEDTFAGYARGRYRVTAEVPSDWDRFCVCGMPGHAGIGLLPFAGDDRWEYPAEPGRRFTSWCDGAELAIAGAHGWHCAIRERLLFPMPPYPPLARRSGQTSKRGPLDAWIQKLLEIAGGGGAVPAPAVELVRNAARAVILQTIGAFHGRPYRVQKRASMFDGAAVPADAVDVDRMGDELVWYENVAAAWPEMSHPEWSAAIWARARARLLSSRIAGGPGATGALHVPAHTVVAFMTDALYLSADPGWIDDGKAGTLRFKALYDGVTIPRTMADFSSVRWGR